MSSGIQDTIVAVSSPSGRSLHAIIKISGHEAVRCTKDIFVPAFAIDLEAIPTYTSVAGNIQIKEEGIEIPVVLYVMKQPYSYTKEDVVEIHTLGSSLIVEMLLNSIVSMGIHDKRNIRFSQPGEFTKRAFLHGRIDLAQAEATMRIIRAQTDGELKIAVAQLAGDVSQHIKRIQDDAVSLCSYIEAAIDFSDQDIELISAGEIMGRLEVIKNNISQLLLQQETGKVSREGIDTVLFGKPNVGKSSLINALLGKKRALVSEIAGTTRDVVSDILETGGVCFKLMDTAGMDDTKEIVTSRAIEKTHSTLKKAQIILLVFDCNADIGEQLRKMKLDDLTGNVIVVINKCDLSKSSSFPELPAELKKYPLVHTSAMTGEGLERLKEILVENVLGGRINLSGSLPIFNVRQRDALRRSLQSFQQTMESVRNNESYEFIALDLRTAIDALGEIVGEVTTEDILSKIFSEFCIGK
ncbi:MAG: tRNA uridine-5-carboxymethylaminomethyl(34) synthesis GTPase MnmE [Planctomycetes bacterium]|nr:tRNA uridine-5-carboxymethylaminomethyl(34) synthesis GTPase MnmE [Planctomycetota bacterium]